MAWIVQTTEGVLVKEGPKERPLTPEQAEASAQERNVRAEALGVKVRYEAVER